MTDKNLYLSIEIDTEMAKGHIKYLRPYLDAIKRSVARPELPIIEIGIGTGLCSVYLEQAGFTNVFGLDIESEIVDRFNNETKQMFDSEIQVIVADAFNLEQIKNDLQFIACVHHQGLLEHFSEEDIIKLLDHHTHISSDSVIFAVPLLGHKDDHFVYDPHEARWPLDQWVSLMNNNFRLFEYGVFGVDHGHDQAYFVIGRK